MAIQHSFPLSRMTHERDSDPAWNLGATQVCVLRGRMQPPSPTLPDPVEMDMKTARTSPGPRSQVLDLQVTFRSHSVHRQETGMCYSPGILLWVENHPHRICLVELQKRHLFWYLVNGEYKAQCFGIYMSRRCKLEEKYQVCNWLVSAGGGWMH